MAKRSGIPGLSFSVKRASGITSAKQKVARATGVPTTRSGRQQKVGRAVSGGCLMPIISTLTVIGLLLTLLF